MIISRKVTDFASVWSSNNIDIEAYDPGDQVINSYVEKLIADAESEGISEEELEEHLGDLHDYVAERVDETTDNEVERLASKDD